MGKWVVVGNIDLSRPSSPPLLGLGTVTREESDERYYRGRRFRHTISGMSDSRPKPKTIFDKYLLEAGEQLRKLDKLPPVVPEKLEEWDQRWLAVMGIVW